MSASVEHWIQNMSRSFQGLPDSAQVGIFLLLLGTFFYWMMGHWIQNE